MAFWSQGNLAEARRARAGIPSSASASASASAARTAAANMFRGRDSPETNEMFFETTPNVNFPLPARSRWADRMGTSVFDDFPTRRMGSNFSVDPTPSFGSLHRHRQPPSWMSETRGSKESSPAGSDSSLPRHAAFHRADSIPVRVSYESRPGSRSSTPESTGSGSSRPSSGSADQNHHHDISDMPDGMEEHPMPTCKAGKQGFTARHQPKVHHIPIHVEPRDGQQTFTTLTPPIVETPQSVPFHVMHEKSQSRSPPVLEAKRPPFPTEQSQRDVHVHGHPKRSNKAQHNPLGSVKRGNREIPVQQETQPEVAPPPMAPAQPAEAETVDPAPPQPIKPKKKTPFETLEEVRIDVDKLKQNVADFDGAKGDKHYLYLDEMLTRNLIRLDNIETEGNDELRQARRAVIASINECIQSLEQNAISNDVAAAAAAAAASPSASKTPEEMSTADENENSVAETENESSAGDAQTEESAQDNEQEQQVTVPMENGVELSETETTTVALPESESVEEKQPQEIEAFITSEPELVVQDETRLESELIVEEPMECTELVKSDENEGIVSADTSPEVSEESTALVTTKVQEEVPPSSMDIVVVS